MPSPIVSSVYHVIRLGEELRYPVQNVYINHDTNDVDSFFYNKKKTRSFGLYTLGAGYT